MKITVQGFGVLALVNGSNNMELEAVTDVIAVRQLLEERHPELQQLVYRIAVNNQIILGNQELNEGDTVSFIPPFPGG